MKILVLEDDVFRSRFFIERFGQYEIKITENANSAIEYLEELVFDYIFLDNDLGKDNGEGLDVVNFLDNTPGNLNNKSNVIIHSWNRPATEYMLSKMSRAIAAPFNTDIFYDITIDILAINDYNK